MNGPELAFFEDKLGLKIKGIGRKYPGVYENLHEADPAS